MKGIFLWGTGHPDIAGKTDFSIFSGLPLPWPEDLRLRSPWREAALISEGPHSICLFSEKRPDTPAIFITGSCHSVMPMAWHFNGMNCLPEWGSTICIEQSGGRGQLGRSWVSPPGNLYAALRLPPSPSDFSGLMSLIVGYTVILVLQEMELPARLKWPNDILIGGKKAGGILIQNRLETSVAGIGLNLTSAPDRALLRAGHAMEATHLEAEGCRTTPLSLWERLVDRGRFFMERILSGNAASILDRIQSQMAFIDRSVRVDDHTGKSYNARITGLSKNGGLMLVTDNESRTIWSGSIAPLTEN